jgi:hypothetical protein
MPTTRSLEETDKEQADELTKLGLALPTVVALGAIAASSAYAANEFVGGGTWIVSGAALAVSRT